MIPLSLQPSWKPVIIDPFRIGGSRSVRRNKFLAQEEDRLVSIDPIEVTPVEVTPIKNIINQLSAFLSRVDDQVFRVSVYDLPGFSAGEIYSVSADDARALGALATSFKNGAARPYMTAENVADLDAIVLRADRISGNALRSGAQELLPEHQSAAREHRIAILSIPQKLISDFDRTIVEAEAPSVPLREPGEKSSSFVGTLLALGILAVAGYGVYTLFAD